MRNAAYSSVLASTFFIGLTSSSFALDVDAFTKGLQATFAKNGATIEYGNATMEGNNITLDDFSYNVPQSSVPVGTIYFRSIEELDNGGYKVGQVTIDDVLSENKEFTLSLKGLEITGFVIPGPDAGPGLDEVAFYDEFKTGPLSIDVKGDEVFKFANSVFTVDKTGGDMMAFDGSVDGVEISPSSFPDPKARAMASQLGYDMLQGDIKIKGDWDAVTGRMHMPEYAITLNDVGRLNLTLDMSGYTAEFAKQMQDVQAQMAKQAQDQKAQQVAGMAMLGMMQQLTLSKISLRFDDASLTEKLLGFFGKQQGMTAEQMAQAAKGMLPFMTARMGMPELQQQIIAAASQYLDDPKNIEIKAEPAQPISFGQIMGAGMGDPTSIPALVGAKVTANQ